MWHTEPTRTHVGFPGIVAALCSEPCRLVCPMKDAGGAISIRLLERAAIDYARNTEPDQYNIPPKDKSIAIIGAGISGMACALRLATKKYNVTVYEKSERIGGHLYSLLPPEIFLGDIKRQFMHEKYTLCLNTEIVNLDELSFDALYVATGKGGPDFGSSSGKEGVFMGGSLTETDTMHAIAQGLKFSGSIERYLKTGIMSQPEEICSTKLHLSQYESTPCGIGIAGNAESFYEG